MPKVIKKEVADQIANEVLTLIKGKDATLKSNQVVAILHAAMLIERSTRPVKEDATEAATEPVVESA